MYSIECPASSIIIIIFIIFFNPFYYYYYYYFKTSVKNTRRWSKKIKDIVVAGMNTNPGGVPT